MQEAYKRWDAIAYLLMGQATRTGTLAPAAASGRFFFQPEEVSGIVDVLRGRLPEAVAGTLREAESICRHRFNLLGYEQLDYGSEIDWHLDAVSGRRAPLRAWYKVRYLDYDQVGDAKVIWELNRHQHLVKLAKAYLYTGDAKFLEEMTAQWRSWRRQNPYPRGVNWASSLEVGFRSLSWLWVRHLLAAAPLDEGFVAELDAMLLLSGRHIERYLSTYFSPNTHLLGEAVALFAIGLLCGPTPITRRWSRKGWEIILAEAERQIQADGFHFEQSLYYHVYATDLFLHARTLAEQNGIAIPTGFAAGLGDMLAALTLLSAGGAPPRFGDDDGGRLFDPRRNRQKHMTDPLCTGAVLYHRPDWKAAVPGLVEECVWLLGPTATADFDTLSSSPAEVRSQALTSSGLYVLADRRRPQWRLLLDAGPQGAGGAGHGHADALALQVAQGDSELLSDAGTFVYVGAGSERALFRGTAAHNTLQVDGRDQAEPAGPFPWRSLPRVRVQCWTSTDVFDLLTAEHDGYRRLAEPVVHRRTVFFRKPDFWFVLDRAEGAGRHRLRLRWHVAPAAECSLAASVATVRTPNAQLAVVWADADGWTRSVEQAWHSPVYGRKEACQALQFRFEGEVPASCATVLQAAAETESTPLLSLLQDEKTAAGYEYHNRAGSHRLFAVHTDGAWRCGEVASDARFLYYGRSGSGAAHVIVCGGTFLRFQGAPVLESSQNLEWIEVEQTEAALAVRTSGGVAVKLDKQALGRMLAQTATARAAT